MVRRRITGQRLERTMRIHTAHDLAAVARGRRLDRSWSQADAARRAGVSRKWVSDFESGKSTVDLAAVLRLLDALDIDLVAVDPESSNVSTSTRTLDLDTHLKNYLGR